MKQTRLILLLSILLFLNSCITEFIPRTSDDKEIVVVEGLITDKAGPNTIKLSRSLPLSGKAAAKPMVGCTVTVTDDQSNSYVFADKNDGTYVSDPANFQGMVGRIYTLHIISKDGDNTLRYDSNPEELKSVPPIDSLYYVKNSLEVNEDGDPLKEGCTIYLDTHDPTNKTKYFRWEYTETWEFQLPYYVPNSRCWVSANSEVINIKNTSVLGEDRIEKFPIRVVSNLSDRLQIEYSILVDQYSLNNDEYSYWEKVQNLSEQVGGLYDIIPSSIPSNIYCVDDPNQKVLGYFSVSGHSSRRIFIKEQFMGLVDLYVNCADSQAPVGPPIPNLGVTVWIIGQHGPPDTYWILTYDKGCADCTVRGSNTPPDFWPSGSK